MLVFLSGTKLTRVSRRLGVVLACHPAAPFTPGTGRVLFRSIDVLYLGKAPRLFPLGRLETKPKAHNSGPFRVAF
jgi:hypothetical protein